MIIKEYGKYFGYCDLCDEETPKFKTWTEVREYIRRNGWKTTKNEDTEEWENHCPRCRNLKEF